MNACAFSFRNRDEQCSLLSIMTKIYMSMYCVYLWSLLLLCIQIISVWLYNWTYVKHLPHSLLIISNILHALFLPPGGICHTLATVIAQSTISFKCACFRSSLKSKTRNSWKCSHPKLVYSNQIAWNESVRRGSAFWATLLSLPYHAKWKGSQEWAPLLFPIEIPEEWIK